MNRGSYNIPTEAIQHVDRGELIEAIKIMRERTGLSLKDAKDIIDAYIRNPQSVPQVAQPRETVSDMQIPYLAINALEKGLLIEAIKHTRDAKHMGLKEAKEAVERFLDQHPNTKSQFKSAASEEFNRVVKKLITVMVLIGAAVVGYLHFFGK